MALLLLVDDDPNIVETAKDILEEAAHTVDTAGTSAEALALARAGRYDVMIVDLHLPDGSGLDLAAKAHALNPKLLVFLMTGEAGVDKGAAASAIYEILTKPVNPPELLARLQNALARRREC